MRGVHEILEGDVAVVSAPLDGQPELDYLLSVQELTRAARFRTRTLRNRYITGRGLVRLFLAERLGEDPVSLQIVTGQHGKPQLAHDVPLRFNVAHSDGDALFAFTSIGDIGVDIEHVRPLDPVLLSKTSFSKAERDQLIGIDPPRRLQAFFDGWVRKEAIVKADGRGFSIGMPSFTVSLSTPARLIEAPSGDELESWAMVPLAVSQWTRAAVAVRLSSM